MKQFLEKSEIINLPKNDSLLRPFKINNQVLSTETNLMNLDEFLMENGVNCDYFNSVVTEQRVQVDFSPVDIALATKPGSDAHFDPSNARFSEDDLRPQPIIRKSRKQYVPDTLKDARYWVRRAKNNIAAKRSREARRLKENQIVLRASYLEKENEMLKATIQKLKEEYDNLKKMLELP